MNIHKHNKLHNRNMVQLNDEGEDDNEELSFSSLAKKGRDEMIALSAPPAPEPVVEAPKAAATPPDVKKEK